MKKIDEFLSSHPFFIKKAQDPLYPEQFIYWCREKETNYRLQVNFAFKPNDHFPVDAYFLSEQYSYWSHPLWLRNLEKEANERLFKMNRLRRLFAQEKRPAINIIYYSLILEDAEKLWDCIYRNDDELYYAGVRIEKKFAPLLEIVQKELAKEGYISSLSNDLDSYLRFSIENHQDIPSHQ